MLRGEIQAADAGGPDDLLRTYGSHLREALETADAEGVLAATDLDGETLDRVRDGDVGALTLTEAAAVLAADPDRPDAETVAAEARDILLLGMTTAVVDVESLASALDGALEPKELQQKVEGRHPMTLSEYATIHYHLRDHVA